MTDEEMTDFINECGERMDNPACTVTDLEKVAALVSSVDFEIALGGLNGFYCNSAGDKVFETVEALQTIGVAEAADALFLSSQLFPKPARTTEREYRQEHLLQLGNALRVAEAHYETQTPCVWELLTLYMQANIGE